MPEFVPLGIPAFDGSEENQKIKFNHTIAKNNAEKVLFQVRHGSQVVYEEEINDASQLSIGKHSWYWDGFDKDGILDTEFLNSSKSLNLYTTVWYNGEPTRSSFNFSASYVKVKWVDVKIDKNSKRIDVTLRVNLKDGGAIGTSSYEKDIDPDPKMRVPVKINPWDKIPDKTLKRYKKQPIKSKIKTFKDLEKLAFDGLNYHWGRNKSHAIAKYVDIENDKYELYVNAINSKTNSMDDVSLILNTNNDWMRSGNPGTVEDPISAIGNIISREAICYNVGYVKYSNGWGYSEINDEDLEYKLTSAHEIGHTILKAYGGTFYSYGHKGSVNTITQNENNSATKFPSKGEIDIMPYYTNILQYSEYPRYIAHEKDVLSFLWLTKLQLK